VTAPELMSMFPVLWELRIGSAERIGTYWNVLSEMLINYVRFVWQVIKVAELISIY
jgi:hypothetical protein